MHRGGRTAAEVVEGFLNRVHHPPGVPLYQEGCQRGGDYRDPKSVVHLSILPGAPRRRTPRVNREPREFVPSGQFSGTMLA